MKKKTKKESFCKRNKDFCIGLLIGLGITILSLPFIIWFWNQMRPIIAKPIIYIYPEEITNVSIKLSNPEYLTHTYPRYKNSWDVLAYPDGTLEIDNNKYYSLYWESNQSVDKTIKEGFVVKGEDTIEFLEEKLDILGLNYKEKQEFIIYWLPILESNKYNYIRFASLDEISSYMELEIDPKPDTLIRVLMVYKPLNGKINVKEQVLTPVERTGYTIVEWGGVKI